MLQGVGEIFLPIKGIGQFKTGQRLFFRMWQFFQGQSETDLAFRVSSLFPIAPTLAQVGLASQ